MASQRPSVQATGLASDPSSVCARLDGFDPAGVSQRSSQATRTVCDPRGTAVHPSNRCPTKTRSLPVLRVRALRGCLALI